MDLSRRLTPGDEASEWYASAEMTYSPSERRPSKLADGAQLAAIDIGSNSFRLEIGEVRDGHLQRVEYIKEPVRLGLALDADRNLTADSLAKAERCLHRFRERLSGFSSWQVRAVATQTIREARNQKEYLARCGDALGFPVEVISGLEEARLIYEGVSRLLPQTDERRLVIDIGGRSTEAILGIGYVSQAAESFRLGSVSWSNKFFAVGGYSARAFEMAEVAAKSVLEPAVDLFQRGDWDRAYGSSGTVGAISDVLAESGWGKRSISLDALRWLRAQLLRAGDAEKLRLAGLKDDRKPVFAGGVAVLIAAFELLGIEEMEAAQGALRQGVLFDMLAREERTDVREQSILGLAKRFSIDEAQAARVSHSALHLLGFLELPEAEHERAVRKLRWSSLLHEIGHCISPSDSHRHAAYILDHADVAGFTMSELHRLSLLVLGQRGKLKKLDADFQDKLFVSCLACLRLAIIFCHARRPPDLTGVSLSAREAGMSLRLPADWAARFPQSFHLLQTEVIAWEKTSWSLELKLQ
jgi:exopolyphosphatase / guanosine-5'-triphosphate,3'-diphosphate pyrophosphatase